MGHPIGKRSRAAHVAAARFACLTGHAERRRETSIQAAIAAVRRTQRARARNPHARSSASKGWARTVRDPMSGRAGRSGCRGPWRSSPAGRGERPPLFAFARPLEPIHFGAPGPATITGARDNRRRAWPGRMATLLLTSIAWRGTARSRRTQAAKRMENVETQPGGVRNRDAPASPSTRLSSRRRRHGRHRPRRA